MTQPDVAGEGKILFIDAPSGIAGDMLVAALVDVGVPEHLLREIAGGLGVPVRMRWSRVRRAAISALLFSVEEEQDASERSFAEIRALLERARIPSAVRARAIETFSLLAEAEAKVHGSSVEHVHFHEVGALDSIVDIVLACAGFDYLGARVVCSPLPLGRGWVGTRHGPVPLPAPATVHCLIGAPTYAADVPHELVTPTGASLVAVHAREYATWPSMSPRRIGFGAGSRDTRDRPNVVRLVVGDAPQRAGSVWLLEANLDDLTPELTAHAASAALEAGALDVWTTAIGMKKGRNGVTLSVLCSEEQRDAMARRLFSDTSTIGIRMKPIERWERPRRIVEVETSFGPVAVKIADGDELPANIAPEFEACRAAALAAGVSAKTVYAAAMSAALSAQAPVATRRLP